MFLLFLLPSNAICRLLLTAESDKQQSPRTAVNFVTATDFSYRRILTLYNILFALVVIIDVLYKICTAILTEMN